MFQSLSHHRSIDERGSARTVNAGRGQRFVADRRRTEVVKNAPATFQRMMDTALRGLINRHCFVYLDDIIIFRQSIEEHNKNLAIILQKLRELGLKIQPDKCEFLKPELEYLGHIVTAEGVKPNPRKIEAVKNFKQPTNPTEVKSFLELASYY